MPPHGAARGRDWGRGRGRGRGWGRGSGPAGRAPVPGGGGSPAAGPCCGAAASRAKLWGALRAAGNTHPAPTGPPHGRGQAGTPGTGTAHRGNVPAACPAAGRLPAGGCGPVKPSSPRGPLRSRGRSQLLGELRAPAAPPRLRSRAPRWPQPRSVRGAGRAALGKEAIPTLNVCMFSMLMESLKAVANLTF